ncbi:hypothetical protein C8R48DRAFT_771185 [Suillus tomentosus]|nr:hypothetical protein C8R48DRAFT_771185 [Suillus tomentosus]
MIEILVQDLGQGMGRARGKGAHTPTPSKTIQRESRIQEALAGVQGGTYKSYRAAAKAHQVSFQTLHDRATGRHQSIQSAARKRQLLSPSQEAALLDWCRLNSSFTTPLHARAFRTLTKDFDAPLSSYKLKDDFLTIAQALGTHLDEHPALADNARFSALFQVGGAKRRTHSKHIPLSKDSAPNINATSSSHSMSSPTPHFGFGSLLPVSRPPAGLEHTLYTPPSSLQYHPHSSANIMSHGSYAPAAPPTYSFAAPSFVPHCPSHLHSSYSPS